MKNMFTIVIQGAMDEEIDYLIEFYKPTEKQVFGDYSFYIAQYRGQKIIISDTKSGIINATIATMLAVEHYSPNLIINQGCAGAHNPELNVGDIIIGTKSVYVNDFKTPPKSEGQGSNTLEWTPNKKRSYCIESSQEYLEIAKRIKNHHDCRIIFGTLGSGDLYSREQDRIKYLTELFGHDCEDMESIATFKVCQVFAIDRIGFRIISNNEFKSGIQDKNVCTNLQKFIVKFIDSTLDITECGLELLLT